MKSYELGPFTTKLMYANIDVDGVDEAALGINTREMEVLKEVGIENEVSFSGGKALIEWKSEVQAYVDGIGSIDIFGIKVSLLLEFEIINEDGDVVEEIEREFEVEPGDPEWNLSISREKDVPHPSHLTVDLINRELKLEF